MPTAHCPMRRKLDENFPIFRFVPRRRFIPLGQLSPAFPELATSFKCFRFKLHLLDFYEKLPLLSSSLWELCPLILQISVTHLCLLSWVRMSVHQPSVFKSSFHRCIANPSCRTTDRSLQHFITTISAFASNFALVQLPFKVTSSLSLHLAYAVIVLKASRYYLVIIPHVMHRRQAIDIVTSLLRLLCTCIVVKFSTLSIHYRTSYGLVLSSYRASYALNYHFIIAPHIR
jgi:hypothetical protein